MADHDPLEEFRASVQAGKVAHATTNDELIARCSETFGPVLDAVRQLAADLHRHVFRHVTWYSERHDHEALEWHLFLHMVSANVTRSFDVVLTPAAAQVVDHDTKEGIGRLSGIYGADEAEAMKAAVLGAIREFYEQHP